MKTFGKTFSTYNNKNLLLVGQTERLPTIGGILPTVLRLLGNNLPSSRGGAEPLILAPVKRGGGQAPTGSRPRAAGRLGTLWTLLRHLQRRLGLAGVGQRRLNVGHRLAGWRHSGNGAASQDSGAGTNGNERWAVVITEA